MENGMKTDSSLLMNTNGCGNLTSMEHIASLKQAVSKHQQNGLENDCKTTGETSLPENKVVVNLGETVGVGRCIECKGNKKVESQGVKNGGGAGGGSTVEFIENGDMAEEVVKNGGLITTTENGAGLPHTMINGAEQNGKFAVNHHTYKPVVSTAADQYADDRAAVVWEALIGGHQARTQHYRQCVTDLLRSANCQNVLDVACGTGVDSIMLLEEGFNLISVDASDKMLKHALKQRWERRKQPEFDNWVIEEGNWLTLVDDLKVVDTKPAQGFDAIICLGNSFGHVGLLDVEMEGCKPVHQKRALSNFRDLLKPGGILILDHRNYDQIFTGGQVSQRSIYYNGSNMTAIKCSTLFIDSKPAMLTMDYTMDVSKLDTKTCSRLDSNKEHKFRLSSYPLLLEDFSLVLRGVFGEGASYEVLADFKPIRDVEMPPSYYIHLVRKSN